MTKPVILQVGPLPDWDEEALARDFDVKRYFDAPDGVAYLAGIGASVRGIVTRGDLGADTKMIAACPNLEIITIHGVGFDGVDIASCKLRGIRVTNTPDVLTKDVADFGLAMMLAHARGIIGGENWIRSGNWARKGVYPMTRSVYGKRAGILGLGRIGFEVARRLAAFDMEINYFATTPKENAKGWNFIPDPVELAKVSDYFFVALAASEATRHIVNAEVIDAVGPDGMIINISRAANIDEEAMITALETGRLGFAALDVFKGEPNIDPRFLQLPNVLLSPHQASGSIETRKAMGKLMRNNLTAYFEGRDLLTPVS